VETKAVLKKLSLLTGLDERAIGLVEAIVERKTFAKGATIYCEGDEDGSIFILARGMVRIEKIVNFDQQQTLEHLGPGDLFGELSFILGGEHCASALALEETEIIQLRRNEFNKLANREPALGYHVMVRMATLVATRLREMDEKFVDLVDYVYGRSKK
jgi:CRP-like cAMP-binding protein